MTIDYAARVAKGAALLDEKKPGWAARINLGALEIQSCRACITAQLSGANDFLVGMEQLGLDDDSYVAHGFDVDGSPEAYGMTDDAGWREIGNPQQVAYVILNILWRELITERLAAGEKQSA